MTKLYDTDKKATIKKADGTSVNIGLKEIDCTSVEDILNVPDCVCNLMPAAGIDEATGRLVFPVEYTLKHPHPQAFFSCTAEEWKTSPTIREEWEEAQKKLTEEYLRVKEEQRILDEMNINPDALRN